MEEVAETLKAIGIDPIMAEATARRQDWSAQMDLRSYFSAEGPKTYQEVVDVLDKLTENVHRKALGARRKNVK